LGTLHQTQKIQKITPCNSAHADLIWAIHSVWHSLTSIAICFKHVKGYQDEFCSASSLPYFTQLNILASQLAKSALLCLLQHCQCWVGLLVGDNWSLHINSHAISSDPQLCIIWHLGYCMAYKYMVAKKQQISSTGFALISFPALSSALKSASPHTGCGTLSLSPATWPLGK